MAQHSVYNKDMNIKAACSLPLVPFKTKIDGPANVNYPFQSVDIIEEGFQYFRINVLFKNFEIKGPGDKILIYLFVFLSHLFKTLEQVKDEPTARKRLTEVLALPVPGPKQKGNFLAGFLTEGSAAERQAYNQYIKQLRGETASRFLQKFFGEGMVNNDFKFWVGLSKKKFMNLNFTSMF